MTIPLLKIRFMEIPNRWGRVDHPKQQVLAAPEIFCIHPPELDSDEGIAPKLRRTGYELRQGSFFLGELVELSDSPYMMFSTNLEEGALRDFLYRTFSGQAHLIQRFGHLRVYYGSKLLGSLTRLVNAK